METKNEIQKTEQASPNEMIRLAIEGNADLEKVEKLLDLQIRYEKNEARKAFSSDFSVVQANIAAVVKTKVNPQTKSNYAGLEDVLETSKPVYTEQGFSVIFYEGKADVEENIRVCADVLHRSGHKETFHLDVPLDGKGIKGNVNMTKIHGKASSISYGRRYLLCMIWNIPTQDDDGNAASGDQSPKPPGLTETNKRVIAAICARLQTDLPPGESIDTDKIASIFLSGQGAYPQKIDNIAKAVEWLLKPEQKGQWAKDASPADEVFARYVTHHSPQVAEGMVISHEKFKQAFVACKVPVDSNKPPAQWAIENIDVKKTLVAKGE